MNKKTRNIIIAGVAASIIAGAIVYSQVSKYFVPSKKAIPDIKPPVVASTQAATTNYFPLSKGSNNQYVGQLQDALGITIDNKFGNDTLSALQEQTGKSSITGLDELNVTIDAIIAQDASGSDADLSAKLIAGFGNNPNLRYIKVLKATNWKQVQQDYQNNWLPAGYQLSLGTNKNMNLSDYTPFYVDDATGSLIIFCNKGANIGFWRANPNDLTLI